MSRWNARYKNDNGEYEITFASENHEETKAVERLCQMIIDGKIKSPDDFAAVVRCRDCEYWVKDVAGCTEFVGRCAHANYFIGASGYCLYGERKEP